MASGSDETVAPRPERRNSGIAALFFSSIVDDDRAEIPQPALPLRIGSLLDDGEGRYELVEAIAIGRQAAVFRAIDRRWSDSRLDVAVKLFPRQSPHSVERGSRDQALIEGRVTRLSRGANVVTVLDAGTTREGWPFLVMEMLDAIDLRAWKQSRSERIDPRWVAHIGRDVARGLVAVHAAELVHCDVSPQNILVDKHDRAILADFGCAKQARSDAANGVTGGTPAFMPAEQWHGADPDSRTDVAALGGVLYWLLTGEAPYGETLEFIQASHAEPAEADARRRRALGAARVDQELAALVRAMLSADPAARPTAADVFGRLDARLSRAQRLRLGWLVAAALVTIAVAGGVARYLRPPPIAVSLGTSSEFDALEVALGVPQTDERLKLLVARGRGATEDGPSTQLERDTLRWLDGRIARIAQADSVSRWVVAMLAASLALELDDLDEADRWLKVAESALNAPTSDSLRGDQRWLRRHRGLVAAAATLRHRREQTAGLVAIPSAAEAKRLDDWLDAGRVEWRYGAETPTSLLLKRMRGYYDGANGP